MIDIKMLRIKKKIQPAVESQLFQQRLHIFANTRHLDCQFTGLDHQFTGTKHKAWLKLKNLNSLFVFKEFEFSSTLKVLAYGEEALQAH